MESVNIQEQQSSVEAIKVSCRYDSLQYIVRNIIGSISVYVLISKYLGGPSPVMYIHVVSFLVIDTYL